MLGVPRGRLTERRLLVAATAVGAAVRMLTLGAGLWVDEGVTLSFVQRGAVGMVRLFGKEPNGLLYDVVLYPLAQISQAAWVLRAPSFVAGVLAVPALYWAARALGERRAALPAAALLAVSPLAIKESGDARPYAFVVLLCCLTFGALATAIRRGGWHWWLAYTVTLAAITYCNAFAALPLLIPHGLLVLQRGSVRTWVKALVLAAVLQVPQALLLLRDRGNRNPLYWLHSRSIRDLVIEEGKIVGYHPVLGLLQAGILVAAIVMARPRIVRSPITLVRHPLAVVLAWAAAPPVVAFAISQGVSILKDRYFIAAVPGTCLLVAAALVRLPRGAARPLVAFIVLGSLAVVGHRNVVMSPTYEDWRSAMHDLRHLRQPADPVIFDTAEGLAPAGYYLDALTMPRGQVVVTAWGDRLPAHVSAVQAHGGFMRVPDGPVSRADVQDLSRRTGRLFVVVRDDDRRGPAAWSGPGAAWSRSHCRVDYRLSKRVTVVVLTGCS